MKPLPYSPLNGRQLNKQSCRIGDADIHLTVAGVGRVACPELYCACQWFVTVLGQTNFPNHILHPTTKGWTETLQRWQMTSHPQVSLLCICEGLLMKPFPIDFIPLLRLMSHGYQSKDRAGPTCLVARLSPISWK